MCSPASQIFLTEETLDEPVTQHARLAHMAQICAFNREWLIDQILKSAYDLQPCGWYLLALYSAFLSKSSNIRYFYFAGECALQGNAGKLQAFSSTRLDR